MTARVPKTARTHRAAREYGAGMVRPSLAPTAALVALALAALALAACAKPTPPPAPVAATKPVAAPPAAAATTGIDDPWALAPPAPIAAAVVDSRALVALDHDLQVALPIVQLFSGGKGDLSYAHLIQSVTGVAHATSLGDAGLDPARGLVVFATHHGWVAVLPVADRDRFIAAHAGNVSTTSGVDTFAHMSCATRRGRYVCASDPDGLRGLGTGAARIRDRWPADLHGDLEVWVQHDELGDALGRTWLDPTGDAVLAVTAEHGFVTARLRVPGRWNPILAKLADRPARFDARGARGFLALDLGAVLPLLAAAAPPTPVAAGVTQRDVAGAFDGRLQIVVPDGVSDLEARVGLARPAPIQALVDHCPQLLAGLGQITATAAGGTCHLGVSQGGKSFNLDVWVAGNELRAASHRHAFAPATGGGLSSPIGAELADGSWTATAWGHGSLFQDYGPPRRMPVVLPGMRDVVSAFMSLSELGFGIRIGRDGVTVLAHVRLTTADSTDVQAALDGLVDDLLAGKPIEPARRRDRPALPTQHVRRRSSRRVRGAPGPDRRLRGGRRGLRPAAHAPRLAASRAGPDPGAVIAARRA